MRLMFKPSDRLNTVQRELLRCYFETSHSTKFIYIFMYDLNNLLHKKLKTEQAANSVTELLKKIRQLRKTTFISYANLKKPS